MMELNHQTREDDVLDGKSNTILLTEINSDLGPWARGGRPTSRMVQSEPVINGPDGIGGESQDGFSVLMVDGRVRRISNDVDPDVFRAMVTRKANDNVQEF